MAQATPDIADPCWGASDLAGRLGYPTGSSAAEVCVRPWLRSANTGAVSNPSTATATSKMMAEILFFGKSSLSFHRRTSPWSFIAGTTLPARQHVPGIGRTSG
jgi:hypothetical protein